MLSGLDLWMEDALDGLREDEGQETDDGDGRGEKRQALAYHLPPIQLFSVHVELREVIVIIRGGHRRSLILIFSSFVLRLKFLPTHGAFCAPLGPFGQASVMKAMTTF
tara:strand:+ start:166 stop:489 length:324 start_codon:yes stop_codon:yes gene_type:complete